jgi:hypothetical protein
MQKREERINELKDCKPCPSCGWKLVKTRGKIFDQEKVVFTVGCNNLKCKKQPQTGNALTLTTAKKAWDKGLVTDSLFK